MKIDFRGRTYSLRQFGSLTKLPYSVIIARSAFGWSAEKIAGTPYKKSEVKRGRGGAVPVKDHLGRVFSSLKRMAEAWDMPPRVVHRRLAAGWHVKRALTEPVGYTGPGRRKKKCSQSQ